MLHTLEKSTTTLDKINLDGEQFFKISNLENMRPFFMSIVSNSNHWMFISSNGGLTAGRKNSEFALFPYYTDDKITESTDTTGSKTIFRVKEGDKMLLWEPFSIRNEGRYRVHQNLYKNKYGNKVVFEEVNEDLELTFSYQWSSSNKFGFVRKSRLFNTGSNARKVALLDGVQNVLPYGVESELQKQSSNLVDAYKRSELETTTGLGIYALSAIIVDRAEPSEALKANIIWSTGLDSPSYLLSSLQVNNFRKGLPITGEVDIKAEKGAYLQVANINLEPFSYKDWILVADVNKDHAAITELLHFLSTEKDLQGQLDLDVKAGTRHLVQLTGAADGLQLSNDDLRDARHYANTLFNIMRGGIFDDNYNVEKWDLINYFSKANRPLFGSIAPLLQNLPDVIILSELKRISLENGDKDFIRLAHEYLPLKFSRRHGDPSRPWNKFSINTQNEVDGSKILDYEGNWRDIFQNWEALALSYPEFIESMIHKFLNATTIDGYNPYRVTKDGFDWETIEPDNPWSYIGYWGDHQIIYLLKFLEFIENQSPGKLDNYFNKELFVFANVPYRIKNYQEIIKNPKDTIEFDHEGDLAIRAKRTKIGADGALLANGKGHIVRANFIEKILATILAKLSNFIPEGGIWMSTQRPEWNDANNALVGNGVSMVTLYYLRRFLKFFEKLVNKSAHTEISVNSEIATFFKNVHSVLSINIEVLTGRINNQQRKKILDQLGSAGSSFRSKIYNSDINEEKSNISLNNLHQFIDICLQYLEHSIKANKRDDQLYHAYNLMTVESEQEVSISYLSEMLEGQVAVLSSGFLSATESLAVLDAMKVSKLFREDQYSYLLYPNKNLAGFLERNTIPSKLVEQSKLLSQLVKDGNASIISQDINGNYHFNGNFKNANDLNSALADLSSSEYGSLLDNENGEVLDIFEKVFNHKAFTGRSGTFYGYEGLGSIYWHMVSKLQLAVQECCLQAIKKGESEKIIGKLLEHYYEINEGIGVHKPPTLYGAFPTDPYSHTPGGKGAQQPGMTGQVKEDILSRFGELGVFIDDGKIIFNPCLLRKDEFLSQPKAYFFYDLDLKWNEINLPEDSLCFTYCQIPVIYKIAPENKLEITFKDKSKKTIPSLELGHELSQSVFNRTGEIIQIFVQVNTDLLK